MIPIFLAGKQPNILQFQVFYGVDVKKVTALNMSHSTKQSVASFHIPMASGPTQQVAEHLRVGLVGGDLEQIQIHRFNWIKFCDGTTCSEGRSWVIN